MGEFAYTCAISGLPIDGGDAVRLLLLQESPFDERGSYATVERSWYVRAPPIRARYNSYGTVEQVDPADEAIVKLWLDGLDVDLLEVGVGQNPYHDPPARKGMSFDMLRDALWEHRVNVRYNIDRLRWKAFGRPKVPKGVPTLRRVEKALRAAGFEVAETGEDEGFFVDMVRRGEARVRMAGYPEQDAERAALDAIAAKLGRRYATMVAPDNDMGHAEVRVCPRFGTKDGGHSWHFAPPHTEPQRLAVRQAMVREDVWQALLGLTVDRWKKGREGVAIHAVHAREAWDVYRTLSKHADLVDMAWQSWAHKTGNPVACMTIGNPSIGGYGLDIAWRAMTARTDLTEAQIAGFLDTMGELALIQSIMSTTRIAWSPARTRGPQFGEWREHEAVLKALLGVASVHADKERAREE